MTKSELINELAVRTELSKKDSDQVVNTMLEIISDSLADGEKVALVGFGTFEVRHRAARKGHNPKTKKPMNIPASNLPVFRAGKNLKEAVAKK